MKYPQRSIVNVSRCPPPLQKWGGMVNYLPSLLHLMSLKCCQAKKGLSCLTGFKRGLCCSLGYRGGKKGGSTEGRPTLSFIPRQDQEQNKTKKKRRKATQ